MCGEVEGERDAPDVRLETWVGPVNQVRFPKSFFVDPRIRPDTIPPSKLKLNN